MTNTFVIMTNTFVIMTNTFVEMTNELKIFVTVANTICHIKKIFCQSDKFQFVNLVG